MTTKPRKGSLLGLRDKGTAQFSDANIGAAREGLAKSGKVLIDPEGPMPAREVKAAVAPSREGRKAMTGYFPPELSQAMRMTALRHGMTLQDLMGEAFNDVLRKYGESPVGL